MRALGRELGVTHGALYRYFPDLKSLLAALGADMAEALAPASRDLSWQDWLRETARAIRKVIRVYPDAGSPLMSPIVLPAAHRMIADGLTVLTRTFEGGDAMVALALVSRVADAFARSELAADDAEGPLSPELERILTEVGVPIDVSAAADPDAAFERELDIVLAGLDVTLPKRS
jgi:AcrR family transcriptional regulator